MVMTFSISVMGPSTSSKAKFRTKTDRTDFKNSQISRQRGKRLELLRTLNSAIAKPAPETDARTVAEGQEVVVALNLLRAGRKALLGFHPPLWHNSFAFSPHTAVERLIARTGMTTVEPLGTGILSSTSPDSEVMGTLRGMTSSMSACAS